MQQYLGVLVRWPPDNFIRQDIGPKASVGHERIEQDSYVPLATLHHRMQCLAARIPVLPAWLAG